MQVQEGKRFLKKAKIRFYHLPMQEFPVSIVTYKYYVNIQLLKSNGSMSLKKKMICYCIW